MAEYSVLMSVYAKENPEYLREALKVSGVRRLKRMIFGWYVMDL